MDKVQKENYTKIIEDTIRELRPFLEADGGDITFVELTEDLMVKVELHGSCSSCSMSPMTLKGGLEESIKIKLPEIKGIEAINLVNH